MPLNRHFALTCESIEKGFCLYRFLFLKIVVAGQSKNAGKPAFRTDVRQHRKGILPLSILIFENCCGRAE